MDGGKWGEIPAHVSSARSQTAGWDTITCRRWLLMLDIQSSCPRQLSPFQICEWMIPSLGLPVKKIIPTLAYGPWFSLGQPIIWGSDITGCWQSMRAFTSGLPAGRGMNFVTAQLPLVFAMTFQKAANLRIVAHLVGLVGIVFENKWIGQVLLVVVLRHFLLPKWFSWAR